MIICANLWTKNSVEKKAVDLRAASRNHEVPWDIHAEPSRVFEKAADFRAPKKEMLKGTGGNVKCLRKDEKS